MKTKTKIGLGFLLSGAALQLIATTQEESTMLSGTGMALFLIGVVIEIVGYAFEDKSRTKNKD